MKDILKLKLKKYIKTMEEVAIKKILDTMLKPKYPKIKDFYVSGDEFYYTVGIYLRYDDMAKFGKQEIDEIKKEVREYSKYVTGNTKNNKRVNHVYFYEPHNS
jgi:ketopantoate reductase